jgi:hypothetical protein
VISRTIPLASIIFIWALVAVSPVSISAQNDDEIPKIKKFRWTETPDGYHITALLNRGFNPQIEDALNAGIPVSFHYYLNFELYRWYWNNKVVSGTESIYTVTYDTLRKVYTIVRKKSGEPRPLSISTTDDEAIMRSMMCSFEGDLDVNRNRLADDRQYLFTLIAKVKFDTDSRAFELALSFGSENFETPLSRHKLRRKGETK